MDLKIERLLLAMAAHEGWYPPGTPGYPEGSRSYRHNNPGNLRVSPFQYAAIDNFAVFKNEQLGWMAFHYDIMMKAKGKTSTGLGPRSTLRELLHVWAPPSDNNDTEAYIKSVCKNSGLTPDITLAQIFNF